VTATEKSFLPSIPLYAAMTWNSDYKESNSFLPVPSQSIVPNTSNRLPEDT